MASAFLNTARRAAINGKKVIDRYLTRPELLEVQKKAPNDFVTSADTSVEDAIVDTIGAVYPEHAFLTEEKGLIGGRNAPYTWIIDPIDGTTNFLHGFPQFAISIALRHENQIVEALVYDVVKDEMFSASRGQGAFLNNRRIRVRPTSDIHEALFGVGFPFLPEDDIEAYFAATRSLTGTIAGFRRAGAASLDLAYVACGRLDAYFESGLKPWDCAAGALIVLEAGGLVTDFAGNPGYMQSGQLVCATPKIFPWALRAAMAGYGKK